MKTTYIKPTSTEYELRNEDIILKQSIQLSNEEIDNANQILANQCDIE